jgi:hypothetical protein
LTLEKMWLKFADTHPAGKPRSRWRHCRIRSSCSDSKVVAEQIRPSRTAIRWGCPPGVARALNGDPNGFPNEEILAGFQNGFNRSATNASPVQLYKRAQDLHRTQPGAIINRRKPA